MFVSGGENIYPEEIERALMDWAGIKRCIVVPVPDDRYGQRPVAFVAGADGTLPDRSFFKQALTNLESFKVPDRFFSWPAAWEGLNKIDRTEAVRLALRLMD